MVTRIGQVAVALLAFTFGLHKIDDFDTWWHLAAGRWIATNSAIPATDTLSHTVRDHAWVNLQWGFDLGLYWLHTLGGPVLLSLAGALVFLTTVALLLLRLAVRHAGAPLGTLVVLLVVFAAQERVTLRPELISFLLLAAVLSVVDHARRTDGRLAWLLVPLMIVWANVHALYIVGAFAIVCGLFGLGTRPNRRLLLWAGVAVVAVVVNPYGLDGVLFPLKLLTRLDGSAAVFQTIGEFGSPFAAGATGVSLLFYKVLLVIGALAAVTAVTTTRPFDWGGALFCAGLVILSLSARRNVAIFAVGCVPFLVHCLETVVATSPRVRAFVQLRATALVVATTLAAILSTATVVTGAWYRADNSAQEFGGGIIEGAFPERAVAFARAAQLPSKPFNDMASGGYLTWDDPFGTGVYIDGRLEVYDTAFVTEYVAAVADQGRWQADADRYGIQTAVIAHRFENDRTLAGHLFANPAWTLVYVDEVAAIFVRTAGNETVIARALSLRGSWDEQTSAWLSRPARRWPYPAGRIEGTRAYARIMATFGMAEPAIDAYVRLFELGIPATEEIELRLRVARYFASRGQLSEAHTHAQAVLTLDPANADAQGLLRR